METLPLRGHREGHPATTSENVVLFRCEDRVRPYGPLHPYPLALDVKMAMMKSSCVFFISFPLSSCQTSARLTPLA